MVKPHLTFRTLIYNKLVYKFLTLYNPQIQRGGPKGRVAYLKRKWSKGLQRTSKTQSCFFTVFALILRV